MGLGHELDVDTVALWRLNETAAPTYASAVATVGSSLTAIPATDPARVVGGPGVAVGDRARHFNGSATAADAHYFISAAADAALVTALQGNWSYAQWIRPETTGTRRYLWIYGQSGDASSATNIQGSVALEDSGAVRILQESGTGTDETATQTNGTFFTNGVWQLIVVTKSGTTFKVYRFLTDGSGGLQDTLTVAQPTGGGDAASRLYFGQSSGNTSFFKGAMADAWLDDVVLNDAQAEAITDRSGFDMDSVGAVFYYPFNETADAHDAGLLGQHLRLTATGNGAVAAASVSTSADTFTLAAHPYASGDGPVRLTTTGGLPAGLSAGTNYWIIRRGADSFAFATSQANALLGTAVDVTTQGTGIHTVSRASYLSTAPNYASGLSVDGGVARTMDGRRELASFLGHPTTADFLAALLGNCCIEAWVQPHYLLPELARGIFCFGDPEDETSASNFIAVELTSAFAVHALMEHGSGVNAEFSAASGLSQTEGQDGDRLHVAVNKYQSGSDWFFEVYVNAELVGTSGALINFDGATAGFARLATGPTELGWRGVLDDVRISGKRRTAAEILDSYERGLDTVPDSGPPTITNFNVAPGTRISPSQTIVFDVLDDSGLALVAILVSYADGTVEVAHDGDGFRGLYAGTRAAISGGYRFSIWRSGGWKSAPTFEYLPVDNAGNLGVLDL